MNQDDPKHVTAANVTDEDIKPEGRTDGPKNFGPEFVMRGGQLVPTRPAEHIERTARAVADAARAEGKSEKEVVAAFAGVLPEDHAPVPASAQHVPEVVLGSLPEYARAEHEKKYGKKAYSDNPIEQMQYDIGAGLARDNKAQPLEASDALIAGYTETREAMKEALQQRRERESTTESQATEQARQESRASAEVAEQPTRHKVANPYDAKTQAQERAEFDAGANLATDGKGLPDDASPAAREGFDAALAANSEKQ